MNCILRGTIINEVIKKWKNGKREKNSCCMESLGFKAYREGLGQAVSFSTSRWAGVSSWMKALLAEL